jgi:hypothetical protein
MTVQIYGFFAAVSGARSLFQTSDQPRRSSSFVTRATVSAWRGASKTGRRRDAEHLQDQLIAPERISLLAGMTLEADWIREHHKHAVVWVEDGNGAERMLA